MVYVIAREKKRDFPFPPRTTFERKMQKRSTSTDSVAKKPCKILKLWQQANITMIFTTVQGGCVDGQQITYLIYHKIWTDIFWSLNITSNSKEKTYVLDSFLISLYRARRLKKIKVVWNCSIV